MPRADVTIYLDGVGTAFGRPDGAEIQANASPASAPGFANDIVANILGAESLVRTSAPVPQGSDFPDYADPLDGVVLSFTRREVAVTDDASFAQAINNAQPGDILLLSAGTYNSDQTIDAVGTPTQPIVIKGADDFATKWDATLKLDGQYIYVIGLDCTVGSSGRVSVAGYLNKVLGCKFGNQEAASAVNVDRIGGQPGDSGGRYGEIAYCDFDTQGPNANPDWQPGDPFGGFRQQIKMFTDGTYNPPEDWGWDSVHIDLWIHHCHFHDSHPKASPTNYSSGDNDIIESGEGISQEFIYTLSTNWYVEYNLFKNNDNQGNTLIDFKTRGNVCRGNTCIGNQQNSFWSRTGGANHYVSNYMDSSWGNPFIMFRDEGNIACKNYLANGDFRIHSGDRPPNTYPMGSYGQYSSALNSKLTSNSGATIILGYYYSNQEDTSIYPCDTTIIEDHQGGISYRDPILGFPYHQNTTILSNPSITAPDPVQLSESDVGPAAMDSAPSDWRDARTKTYDPWIPGTLGTTQPQYITALENMVGYETLMYGKIVPDYILDSWNRWESCYTAGAIDSIMTYFQGRGLTNIKFLICYAILPKITGTPGTVGNTDNDGLRDPTVWDRAADGVYDSHFHALGPNIRSMLSGFGRDPDGENFILGLGHEMTGTWYSYSVGNKGAEYRQAWATWTAILKSYVPNMEIEWRPAKNKGHDANGNDIDYIDFMPTVNVDICSLSHHDLTVYRTATDNYNFGNPQYADPNNYQRWHDYHVSTVTNPNQYGLAELESVGRTLGKRIALGESRPQIGDCQTNWWTASPYPDTFIEYTYNWIESVRDIFYYELYLNSDCSRLDKTNWDAYMTGGSKEVLDPDLRPIIDQNAARLRAFYIANYGPQYALCHAAGL